MLELRDKTSTRERVEEFPAHGERFAAQLVGNFPSECSEKMIYFHALRNHVAPLMNFWFSVAGWGYGMFSGSAGEHLNKQLKTFECDHTNHDRTRFVDVMRHFKVQTLHFSRIVFADVESSVKCWACGATGHNKKNRLYPNNISNAADMELEIVQSDPET